MVRNICIRISDYNILYNDLFIYTLIRLISKYTIELALFVMFYVARTPLSQGSSPIIPYFNFQE